MLVKFTQVVDMLANSHRSQTGVLIFAIKYSPKFAYPLSLAKSLNDLEKTKGNTKWDQPLKFNS